MTQAITGLPGLQSSRTVTPRKVFVTDKGSLFLPSAKIIDGSKARDPLNTGDLDVLRAGMLMGKITTGGKYAPSIIGTSDAAYASGTTLDVTAATAVEIVRRIGSSGTFKIAGPPAASGVVAVESVSFSAVNTTNGNVTVTALANNYVSGSFILPDDGSENALSFIPDGTGLKVTDIDDADVDVPFFQVPIAGVIDSSQLINWPSDTGLQAWMVANLNQQAGGKFVFDHLY